MEAREREAVLWGILTGEEQPVSARAALSLALSWFLFSRESYRWVPAERGLGSQHGDLRHH